MPFTGTWIGDSIAVVSDALLISCGVGALEIVDQLEHSPADFSGQIQGYGKLLLHR